jgi:hypothetical protein
MRKNLQKIAAIAASPEAVAAKKSLIFNHKK